jgi:hypothetical protein
MTWVCCRSKPVRRTLRSAKTSSSGASSGACRVFIKTAVLGWQSRFRWILRPGNDLYFVYIHNWLDDPLSSRIYTLDRRATSKISYTYRF